MKIFLLSLAIMVTSCTALLKDEKEIEKVVEDVIEEEVKIQEPKSL
jgi:hypothetical protein